MRKLAAPAAAFVLLSSMFIAPAHADDTDLANRIAGQVMSPFCPGVTLESCPSDKAVALRARIQSWADDGWSEARIMSELVDLYGESIRAVPPRSGAGMWAWLAPGIALAAGGALAALLARRWTRRSPAAADDHMTVPAETRARLDDELDALRGRP